MYADSSCLYLSRSCFLRNPTIQRHQRSFVDQIYRQVNCICSKLLEQSYMYPHAPNILQNGHIHVLGHLILLRIFWNSLHSFDSPIAQNSSNMLSQYLSPLSDFKHLNFRLISFSTCSNHFLNTSHMSDFLLQEVNPNLSTCIINKSHKI